MSSRTLKKIADNHASTFTNKVAYSSLINDHLFVAVAVNATKGVLERTRLSLWSCWYSFLKDNKKSLWFLKLIKHMANGILVGLYMMLALERCIRELPKCMRENPIHNKVKIMWKENYTNKSVDRCSYQFPMLYQAVMYTNGI